MRTPMYAVVAALAAGLVSGVAAAPAQTTRAADPAAVAMLREAHDRRDTFPPTFGGISASLAVDDNGIALTGSLAYMLSGGLRITLNGASKQQEEWVKDQLGSAFSHRRPDDFSQTDGHYALAFADDDHSPLGRKIALNDGMNSYYRVKEGRLSEVTRSMGPIRFTITVMEDRIVDGGRYLPTQFVVTYFDAKTGAIQQVEAFTDAFEHVGGAWVPSARRVVTAEGGKITTRTIALTDIRPLNVRSAR